jgi:hypothetical protein
VLTAKPYVADSHARLRIYGDSIGFGVAELALKRARPPASRGPQPVDAVWSNALAGIDDCPQDLSPTCEGVRPLGNADARAA